MIIMGNSGIGVPLPELAAYCREAAAEVAVLLKNEGHMLPVKKDETVSIFGRSQIESYRSGTGAGFHSGNTQSGFSRT